MDATIKAQWLEALRGDKYAQGKGFLVVPENAGTRAQDSPPGSRCCLGVLLDVLHPGKPPVTERAAYLDSTEMGQLGLSYDTQLALGKQNDEGGKTFLEIADWIEANL